MVTKKAPRTFGVRGAGALSDDATVSCGSCRHAADPWLTNDGKQEAKEDDDEHETVRHDVSLTRGAGGCQVGSRTS